MILDDGAAYCVPGSLRCIKHRGVLERDSITRCIALELGRWLTLGRGKHGVEGLADRARPVTGGARGVDKASYQRGYPALGGRDCSIVLLPRGRAMSAHLGVGVHGVS